LPFFSLKYWSIFWITVIDFAKLFLNYISAFDLHFMLRHATTTSACCLWCIANFNLVRSLKTHVLENPLNNVHLWPAATFKWSQGWPLYTGLTVFPIDYYAWKRLRSESGVDQNILRKQHLFSIWLQTMIVFMCIAKMSVVNNVWLWVTALIQSPLSFLLIHAFEIIQ
jgi:hypothetical protein